MTGPKAITALISVAIMLHAYRGAAAQTGRCAWPPLSIEVSLFATEAPPLDTSLSRQDIAARRASRGAATASELSFGYYEASAATIYQAEMQGRTLPDGNLCLAITSLTVKFGLRSRRIVIASELASRPCLLDHVTRHERKLAAIDDKLVAEFIPLMRDQLEQSWKDGLGVDVRDEPDGHAALKTLIDARLVELRSRFTSARDKAQDALDAEDFAPDALAPACREEQRQLLGTGP